MGLYTHLTGGESRYIAQPFFLAAVPKVYSAAGEQINQCGGADGLTMKDWSKRIPQITSRIAEESSNYI